MGFFSRVRSAVSRTYSRVKAKVTRKSSTSSTTTSSGSTSTSSGTTSTSSGSTSSGSTSSGSSGSGATITQTGTKGVTYLDPVRSTDYVDSSGASAGSTTVSGKNVWSSGSGGGSSGGGKVLSTTFSPETTTKLTGAKVTPQTQQLAPATTRLTGGGTTQTKDQQIWEEIKPKSFLGKSWMGIQSMYYATPFGTSMVAPEEYNIKRETGASKWVSGLTLRESTEGLRAQKIKDYKAQQQMSQWDQFIKDVESAPEEEKYKVYTTGRMDLASSGIRTSEVDGELIAESSAWKPSKSFNVYQWEREDTKTGKALLGTRIVSTKATELYGAGKLIGAVGKTTGISTAVAKVPTSVKVAGAVGLTGAIGYGKTKQYQATETKAEKDVFWLETGGEAVGITALATESVLSRRAVARYNKVAEGKYYAKQQRYEHLKNVKTSGQYSKYAKFEYKQAGVGGQLKPSVQKDLAKQFGMSQKEIGQASVYRQTLRVKSPVGFKEYKTGKWGVEMLTTKGGTTKEIAGTFRIYKGKPTSINFLSTVQKDKFAYTVVSKSTSSGKIKVTDSYLTKVTGSTKITQGDITGYKYLTETRVIPQGYTGKSSAELWKRLTPTATRTKFVSQSVKAPRWFGGVAKEGEYRFIAGGEGKSYLPTKSYVPEVVLKNYGGTKPITTSTTKPPTSAIKGWKPPAPSKSSGNQIIKQAQTPTLSKPMISPTIPVVSVNAVKPSLGLVTTATDYSLGTAGAYSLGLKTTTAMSPRSTGAIKLAPRQVIDVTTAQIPVTSQATSSASSTASPSSFPAPVNIISGAGSGVPALGSSILAGGFGLPDIGGLGGGGMKIGKVKTKAKYKYTPSYTALVFGIKGAKGKPFYGKRYAGFEMRPITKGWMKSFM